MDVKVLRLYHGRKTTGRLVPPIHQLSCVGGTAGCKAFLPLVVECTNIGLGEDDVEWLCKTNMDKRYTFGNSSVNCEGYDYPNDYYIVNGSCGLEYTIDFDFRYFYYGRNQDEWLGKTCGTKRRGQVGPFHFGLIVAQTVLLPLAALLIVTMVYACIVTQKRKRKVSQAVAITQRKRLYTEYRFKVLVRRRLTSKFTGRKRR